MFWNYLLRYDNKLDPSSILLEGLGYQGHTLKFKEPQASQFSHTHKGDLQNFLCQSTKAPFHNIFDLALKALVLSKMSGSNFSK